MQVFKITGKFEQNGKWSELTGYFVKRDDDDVIEGYVEYWTDPIRCIKGVYTNKGRLTFLELYNVANSILTCFDFPNVNEQGFWSSYHSKSGKSSSYGFFPNGYYDGLAQIQLHDIESEEEKMELAREISAVHANKISMAGDEVRYMMEHVKELASALIENFGD